MDDLGYQVIWLTGKTVNRLKGNGANQLSLVPAKYVQSAIMAFENMKNIFLIIVLLGLMTGCELLIEDCISRVPQKVS